MKPRIGIIGGGIFGTIMLKAYSAADRMEKIDLIALADIDENTLEKQVKKFNVKGYLDFKDMLEKENLDAVAIATPDYLHHDIVLEVAKYGGIHMLVQKPLDVNLKGARIMVEAAKKNNLMLYVDFHKRFDPGCIQLKEDIKNGKLGKIQYGYVWVEDKIFVPSVWFKKWAHRSSPAWFIGIHFFDFLYWLLESKPKRIYASGVKDKLLSMGIDTYDSLQAKIEFENGASFTVDSSWILPESFPSTGNQGMRVIGSKGIWEIDGSDRGTFYSIEEDQRSNIPNYYAVLETKNIFYKTLPRGYVIDSMLYFIELIRALKEGVKLSKLDGSYPSGEEALVSTQICEAIHLSAEKKKIVEIS